MGSDSVTKNKVTKRSFIVRLCEKGYTDKEAYDIYECFIESLLDEILAGHKVVLTGFGSFSLKPHKGHKVRFSENESIDDYPTLKFSASHTLNKQIRQNRKELLDKMNQTDDT